MKKVEQQDSADGRFKVGKIYTDGFGEYEFIGVRNPKEQKGFVFRATTDINPYFTYSQSDVKRHKKEGIYWTEEGMFGFSRAATMRELKQ